jgi:DNA-binding transcriptional LysR family regulator
MNLLKYFYYVAKYNSYTKAAEELLISQPSLSYSIKVLEEELNKKLFIRGKKLELTPYGNYLFTEVEKMMSIFDGLAETENVKGKVIIGLRPQYCNKIFPKYFSELNKIYPDLKIEYYQAGSELLEKALNNNEIDLLIDEFEYDGVYKSFLQLDDEMVVITTDKSFKLDEEYLKNEEVCIVSTNKVYNDVIESYKDFNYVTFQSTPLMIEYMVNHNVIGISPKSIVKDYLDSKKMFVVKNNLDLPHAKMYITYNKKLKNKNILAICDYFREHSFYELNK